MLPFKSTSERRANPFRAFGDAVYLGESWSTGMPSETQITALLGRLRKHQFYQAYWDAGCAEPDGSVRFSSDAERFLWTAEPWCQKQKYPMKFKAWVRNHRDGEVRATFDSWEVVRRFGHYLGLYRLFDGVHVDVEIATVEGAERFWYMLDEVLKADPNLSVSVLGRLHWLSWEGFVEALAPRVRDVEFPLFGSGLAGSDYVQWCEEQTRLLLSRVAPQNLILTVPAFPTEADPEDREDLGHAIRGIKQALGLKGARLRLAFYREGLAEEDDWKDFTHDWVF